MKHNARLPRTAGLKTLSELSASLTKAGLDPGRIEQRAELIAKARGLERKRKRDEEMDVDQEGGSGEDEDAEGEVASDWMDVDGEGDDGRSPPKRRKSNTGTTVTAAGKHAPRTNRQTAGMRDQSQVSKAVKLRNLGQRERNMHAKAGESDRAIKVKMVGRRDQGESSIPFAHHGQFVAEAPIFWETKSWKDSEAMKVSYFLSQLRASPLLHSRRRCTLLPLAFWFTCTYSLHAHICSRWSGPFRKIYLYSCVRGITRLAMCRYKRIIICRKIIHQVSTKVHNHRHPESW